MMIRLIKQIATIKDEVNKYKSDAILVPFGAEYVEQQVQHSPKYTVLCASSTQYTVHFIGTPPAVIIYIYTPILH